MFCLFKSLEKSFPSHWMFHYIQVPPVNSTSPCQKSHTYQTWQHSASLSLFCLCGIPRVELRLWLMDGGGENHLTYTCSSALLPQVDILLICVDAALACRQTQFTVGPWAAVHAVAKYLSTYRLCPDHESLPCLWHQFTHDLHLHRAQSILLTVTSVP